MPENIDVAALLAADNIIALVALALAFGFTRLSKDDALPNWWRIPARFRPVVAIALGEVFAFASVAIYNAATVGHITWREALTIGFKAGVGAIFTHAIGVKTLRNGKDVGVPEALSIRPPPPPPGSDGGGLIVPPVPPPRLPRISDEPEPPAAALEELPKPKRTLLFAGVIFVALSLQSCALFTPANASRLLDLSKTLCVLANFASDDTAVQAICGIVDREVGPMKDLLRAERERVAAERAAAQRELVSAGRCDEEVVVQ